MATERNSTGAGMGSRLVRITVIGLFAAALIGCSSNQNSNSKQTVGTLLGAVGGALLGAQVGKGTGRVAAAAVGTLLGAWIGNEVGQSLDRADQAAMEKTTQKSLEESPTGETSSWRNPDTGVSGTVTPERTFQSAEGNYCREFQQTVTIGGKTEEAYGTACRQDDGTWKVVSS